MKWRIQFVNLPLNRIFVGLVKQIFWDVYERFNLLSLDVVSGACAGMYFFADMMRIPLSWYYYLLLALAVWTIYTFDHLLDARKVSQVALSKRHRFHQQHFKPLALVLVLTGIAGALLSVHFLTFERIMAAGTILFFLIVGVMVGMRLGNKKSAIAKELLIATFYVAGIILAPAVQLDFGFISGNWLFYVPAYFILAWFNLVYLSYLDGALDRAEGHHSIMTVLGKRKTRNLLGGLSVLGLIYGMFLFFYLTSYFHRFTLIWAIMMLVHILFFMERPVNITEARRRLELTFSFPLLLFLL